MTAIQALGTPFQALPCAPKQTPFGVTDNSGSFATLLDGHDVQIIPERFPAQTANVNLAPHLASTARDASEDAQQDAAIISESVAVALPVAANNSIWAQNKPAIKGETLIAPDSTLPTNMADMGDLLPANIPGYHVRTPPRLFAFTELGMFGRHSAQFEAAATGTGKPNENVSSPRVADSPTVTLDPVNVGTVVRAGYTADQIVVSNPQAVFLTQQNDAQAVQTVQPLQMPTPQNGDLVSPIENETVAAENATNTEAETGTSVLRLTNPEPAAMPGSLSPFESEAPPAEEGGVPVLPPDLPESRAPSPLNLVVAGADNALTIIARSSDTSAEPANLRRLAESTAAEFGMHVAEVRINGSAVEPSFSPASGGNHGRRAR